MPTETKTTDRYVCPNCFNDGALKRLAHAHAVRNECGFCDSRSDVPIAAPLDVLVAAILDGLQSCYTRDTRHVEFDDEGRPLLDPSATGSVFGEIDWLTPDELPPIRNEKVLQEVVSVIGDTEWYPLMLTSEIHFGRLMLSWADFHLRITEKARFFFSVAVRGDAALIEPGQFPAVAIWMNLPILLGRLTW